MFAGAAAIGLLLILIVDAELAGTRVAAGGAGWPRVIVELRFSATLFRLVPVVARAAAKDLSAFKMASLAVERWSASGAVQQQPHVGRILTGLMATVALMAAVDLTAGLSDAGLAMRGGATYWAKESLEWGSATHAL